MLAVKVLLVLILLIVSKAFAGIKNDLNQQLSELFNPSQEIITTDLNSIEFQYYYKPIDNKRSKVINDIKQLLPFKCSSEKNDKIEVTEARNTFIGNDIKTLRQRKLLYSTKKKDINNYDRSVKVLIADINNFEERKKYGIPITTTKNKDDEQKSKYEINRVIYSDNVKNELQYSSTVEFDKKSNMDFINIFGQRHINKYFKYVYSSFISNFKTKTTYLSWTSFECDNDQIGKIKIQVQIVYATKKGALDGNGKLLENGKNKISYKVKDNSKFQLSDYEKIQKQFTQFLSPILICDHDKQKDE